MYIMAYIYTHTHVWYNGMVWYGMVWYGMVWYGTSMVWYGTVWYCMVWYGMYACMHAWMECNVM